jgi:hypothetical protein
MNEFRIYPVMILHCKASVRRYNRYEWNAADIAGIFVTMAYRIELTAIF